MVGGIPGWSATLAGLTLTSPTITGTLSGSGVGVQNVVHKTSDETVNNSSTLQNDDVLLFAAATNTNYAFEIRLLYDTNSTADLKVAITVPTGGGVEFLVIGQDDAAANLIAITSASGAVALRGIASGTVVNALLIGTVRNGGTAGNIQLQWAQNTANVSDSKVLSGSSLTYWKVG